jgi:hypothetical protein
MKATQQMMSQTGQFASYYDQGQQGQNHFQDPGQQQLMQNHVQQQQMQQMQNPQQQGQDLQAFNNSFVHNQNADGSRNDTLQYARPGSGYSQGDRETDFLPHSYNQGGNA